MSLLDRGASILVAGAETVLGAALVRELARLGHERVLVDGADWTDARATNAFFSGQRVDYVIVAAGESGGISRNKRQPATLMLDNLRVTTHLLSAAFEHQATKLIYLGSSCSYPREGAQPLVETSFLTGPLEPTSQAYAVSKIAGVTLCDAYRREHRAPFVSAIPANVFGPGDDFSEADSHVIGALVRRAHAAKIANAPSLSVWGTGTPVREFLYADDAAGACLFALEHYDGDGPINLGPGTALSIAELARHVADAVGFRGDIVLDTSKPDGAPVKKLDSRRLEALGFRPRTRFPDALAATYRSYLESHAGT